MEYCFVKKKNPVTREEKLLAQLSELEGRFNKVLAKGREYRKTGDCANFGYIMFQAGKIGMKIVQLKEKLSKTKPIEPLPRDSLLEFTSVISPETRRLTDSYHKVKVD